MNTFVEIDKQLLKWAYHRDFKNTLFIKALIFMGDGPFWMLIVFFAALAGQLFNINAFHHLSILLIFALMISNWVFVPFKTRIKRKRPYANKMLHQDLGIVIKNRDPGHGSKELESFPSGHVLWTTLCVTLICFQFGEIALLLFGWMIPAMIFLRPYLGVHYPSDALAGLAIGSINAVITLIVSPYLLDLTDSMREASSYIYCYWILIVFFLFSGLKSWLKRV